MLSLRVKVDVVSMAMKRFPIFPKAPGLESHYEMVLHHIQDVCLVGATSSAEVHSVYSTAPHDWAARLCVCSSRSKVGVRSRGLPESSLFNSYHTEV